MEKIEAHLTVREMEILKLVSEGWTAKEIAMQLNIAPRTVDTHKDHVRR